MKHRQKATTTTILFLVLITLALPSRASGTEHSGKLGLSPELNLLLKAEMVELAEGVRVIALSLATADWEELEITSGKMHESYIMKKSLTPTLGAELKERLPHGFKQLDAKFHDRALKLRHAAELKDFELSAFHFSKLVESCAGCHSVYAVERFPGFHKGPPQRHEH